MAESETIYRTIREAANRLDRPIALAAQRDGEWRPISHRELLERVRNLSLGLYDLGIRKGDRVAILSESRPSSKVSCSKNSASPAITSTMPTT